MVKFVPLEAVLNYIPESIKQQTDKAQILSWANLAYRTYKLPFKEKVEVKLLEVRSHRIIIPDDVVRIMEVRHSNPGVDLPKEIIRDYGEYRLIIAQEVFFASPWYRQARPLRYLGQHRGTLIDEQLYNKKCADGFSIDETMTCMTIDYPDGEAAVVYKTLVDGIPDEPNLMQGLSYYVESCYWREKVFAHESNAYQLSDAARIKSRNYLEAFKGAIVIEGIDTEKHNNFVFRRNRFVNWKRN